MRIGVISDTHIPISAEKIPEKVCKRLESCDLIIHAGDFIEMNAIEELEKICKVEAVYGNMDSGEIKKRFSDKMIFEVEGKKIGVVHGSGPADHIIETVKKAFEEKLDIIIFGHSHVPCNEVHDGTLFFNPGSVTDKISTKYCSFGMIEIKDGKIHSEIIKC